MTKLFHMPNFLSPKACNFITYTYFEATPLTIRVHDPTRICYFMLRAQSIMKISNKYVYVKCVNNTENKK